MPRNKIQAMARDVGEPEGSNIPVAALFQKKYGMQAGNIIGTGTYKPDYTPPDPTTGLTTNVTPFWMCAAAGAEVEVDTETGHVRILKFVNVVDCGKPINPRIVETQISGASLMQLGFTMFEKMQLEDGQVTNASLADYKIPGIHDLPQRHGERGARRHPVERPVRRQGRRRDRDVLRLAGDRQRDRRCLRRAPDGAAAQARSRAAGAARQGRQADRGRLT